MDRIKLQISKEYEVLSSESRIFKTEVFIKKSKYHSSIDTLLSCLGGVIVQNYSSFEKIDTNSLNAYKIDFKNLGLSLLFKFGKDIQSGFKFSNKDIIFYSLEEEHKKTKTDSRIIDYLSQNQELIIEVELIKDLVNQKDFLKIYVLTNEDGINFPLLNAEQQILVENENQNVVVQGVAGSGKTNICLNKILFTACREYGGRVLYTTYSRGLILDTKNKLEIFKQNLTNLIKKLENNKVIFADSNHRKALENKLGIWLDEEKDDKIKEKLKRILNYLDTHIDLVLLEDIYEKYFDKLSFVANEEYFVKTYSQEIKNYQLQSKFEKIKYLTNEIIYKEIYGMIFGCYNESSPKNKLSLNEYIEERKNSFTRQECETIYQIALDYEKHLIQNNILDNNSISKKLISEKDRIEKYSLSIIDEVQDFTQVNLYLIKEISRKMFCVGDAMQMINPSFFTFSYLKRLMYQKDLYSVAELKNNYRSTKLIADIIEELSKINIKQFGTHSFMLNGSSVDSEAISKAYFINSKNLINDLKQEKLDNITLICQSTKEKQKLKKELKNIEILSVAEIKGLERQTVILYDILSSSKEKWDELLRQTQNKKTSDENSVYRYYFNLLYVALSRSKQYLYVFENSEIELFKEFFNDNFEKISSEEAVINLIDLEAKNEVDTEELLKRVNEFINLEQYDNAEFIANKINDIYLRKKQLSKIEIYKTFVKNKNYRLAGIELWKNGLIIDAKTQFRLSKDTKLIELMEACQNGSKQGINGDIVEFLPEVMDNKVAYDLIFDTLKTEIKALKQRQNQITKTFEEIK